MSNDAVEILLVEDNPNDIALTLYAFKKSNIANHVQVLRDGVEALDFIFCTGPYAHRHIDDAPKVILLDFKLPLVDGLEVLQRIKSDPRTRPFPVVMLTSSSEERDMVESYQLGVDGYIRKPVDFDQFASSMQAIGIYWLLINKQSPVKLSQKEA